MFRSGWNRGVVGQNTSRMSFGIDVPLFLSRISFMFLSRKRHPDTVAAYPAK